MPSIWEMLGETLGETALGPLLVGGAIVSIVAVPDVRKRLRRWSVQGAAAALAAAELASRQMRVTGEGTQGVMSQVGRRVRRAAADIREEWDDFVAEVQAARERRAPGAEEPQASREAGEERRPRGGAPPATAGGEPTEYGANDREGVEPPGHHGPEHREPA